MAKRFQPMKEFGRTTKKPKLDMSVNKLGRLSLSLSKAPNRAVNEPAGSSAKKDTSPGKSSPNNFWDDDDDDVILLATQVAESQVAAGAIKATTNVVNLTDGEITFSEFGAHVHAATSTQRMLTPEAMPRFDTLSVMFEDDDDDFEQLAVQVVEKENANSQSQANQDREVFKKPTVPGDNVKGASQRNAPRIEDGLGWSQDFLQPLSQTQARRQWSSERQIKFLMDKIDELKKDKTKLEKDLSESKNKIQTKDGETSLLRDELRHLKQQIQTLKMEKIYTSEAAKTESKAKIAELSKKVEAKEMELGMKNVEFSILKMQHETDVSRLEMSMDMESMAMDEGTAAVPVPMAERQKKSKEEKTRELMDLFNLRIHDVPISIANNFTHSTRLINLIYEPSHDRGTSKKQRTLFQLELEKMQTIVAQLQLTKEQNLLTAEDVDVFTKKTIDSVAKVFPEFWSYAHSLEFPKNCRIHPYHDYDLSEDSSETTRQSLHQPTELYEEERALSLRRYVSALSVLCQRIPKLSHALLAHRSGEYHLLQIAIDGICKLGFSREVCEHFGVLESFAALLHSMIVSLSHEGEGDVTVDELDLLVSLLKHITFNRPSAWIFRHLSACIEEFMRLPKALSLFCVNSASNTFYTDRVRSLYRFSNDSCFLQVYAGLLEIAFPLNTRLTPKKFELLTEICLSHVHFAYYCFENPPKFVVDMLPLNDDEPEDCVAYPSTSRQNTINADQSSVNAVSSVNLTSATSTSTTLANESKKPSHQRLGDIRCECYTKLCLSVVTLLFQVLRQWIRAKKTLRTSRVAEISKISLQLLHIIFCDNYLTRLFRESEETTRHYLYLLCKWWSENAEVFQFNDIHKKFLCKLQNSHVMPKRLNDEENLANIANDLAEWYRCTSENSDKLKQSAQTTSDSDSIIRSLRLMEDACDPEKFFEGLKGYAFDFQ